MPLKVYNCLSLVLGLMGYCKICEVITNISFIFQTKKFADVIIPRGAENTGTNRRHKSVLAVPVKIKVQY